MASTIWKGHLSFGLISVPVRLFAAARPQGISFNLIHKACGTRIRMQTHCPTCDNDVERSELVKGYEVEDGQYVLIEPSDLEKITPPSGHTMEVLEFTRLQDVDPLYFDASYFLVPEEAGRKAYYLLAEAMRKAQYVGIARLTMHQREHLVVVRPALEGIMLHTLFYGSEVRKVDEFGHPEQVQVNEKELDMATLFIKTLAAEFDPDRFSDAYLENVRRLIEAKAHGQRVAIQTGAAAPAPVLDLMAALKASIERSGGPPQEEDGHEQPVVAPAAEKPARKAARTRKAG